MKNHVKFGTQQVFEVQCQDQSAGRYELCFNLCVALLDLHALDACLTALYAFQVVVWSAVQVLFAGEDGVGVCDREMSSLLAQHFAFPVTSQSVSSLLTYHQDDLVTCIAYHSSYIRAPDNVCCTRLLKANFLITPRPQVTSQHDSEHRDRRMRYP